MKTNKEFIREMSRLSLPLGMQQMVSCVVSLIDNVMVGTIGEAAMSAVSICVAYTWLSTSIAYSFCRGALIIGAQDYGRGDRSRIRKLLTICLYISLLTTGVFFLFATFAPRTVIAFYSNYQNIIDAGEEYLNIMKYSILFYIISETILINLQTVKTVKIGFKISLVSCFSNLILNFLLINGNLGMPALGLKGAAIATTISRFLEMVLAIYYLFFVDQKLSFTLKDLKVKESKTLTKQLISVTLPLLVGDLLDNLLSTVQTMITGRISENYISANSIVHTCWELPAVFCRGSSIGAAIIIGNSLGARNYDEAKNDSKRIVYTALLLGLGCSIAVQVIMFIVTPFYAVSNETILLARQMSYACSVNVVFISLEMIVINGIINAAGKTKKILYLNLITNWGLAIPLGYIAAFILHIHPAFIYLILRIGCYIRATWGLIQLKKGNWMNTLSYE